MSKLHELLAVEQVLSNAARDAAKKIVAKFKANLVSGHVFRYKASGDRFAPKPDDIRLIAAKVPEELEEYQQAMGRWIDNSVRKEMTNQETHAHLKVDDVDFGSWSATALLNLESKLASIRTIYDAIPTNGPAIKWHWDEQEECWRSDTVTEYSTRKVQVPIVLYDATTEHVAQTQLISKDVLAGEWEKTFLSGALTPADKRKRLQRIDKLIRAVKKARQRANHIDAVEVTIAKNLFDYIDG